MGSCFLNILKFIDELTDDMARTLTEPEKQDLKKKWGMNSDDPACEELDGTFTYLSKDVANVSSPWISGIKLERLQSYKQ